MSLSTVGAVMNFFERMQEETARFYEELAMSGRCPEHRETFLSFSKEDRKLRDSVLRAYRETITDAFEVGFSFRSLNEDDYEMDTTIKGNLGCSDIILKAMEVEEKGRAFCHDVGENSKAFLADIPRALERVSNRKAQRKQQLESLLRKKPGS